MSEKFRDRGFEILAVSDEGEAKIGPYVKQHEIDYGVVHAENVLQTYGGRGYPSAWVVGPDGKVLWGGHPDSVSADMVEGWVKDLAPTKVDRELHKDLRGAVKDFNDGDYGKALADAKEVAAKAEDAQAKEDAAHLQKLVQKHVDACETKMKAARENKDLVKLGVVLEEAAEKFKGSELGDKWESELKDLEKSDEYKDSVDARDDLDKIRDKLEDMRPASARNRLERIAEKYPDTPAGKEAAELAKRYKE